jgi:hypothetical protein
VIWQDVVAALRQPKHGHALDMLLHTFKTRWNWTYEILDDVSIDSLASASAFPALLLAVAITAVLVSDSPVICVSLSDLFEQGDQTIAHHHNRIVLLLEEAFIQSFRASMDKEGDGVALCQAMFIYGVHCKTQSKDASILFDNGKGWYMNMADMIKKHKLTSDKGEEKSSQVRSRIFWNIAAQDINYSLSYLITPAISYTDIQRTSLPHYCKEIEANRHWRYVLVWFRARICRDVLNVAHHKLDGSDIVQEAIRRLQVTELLLPEPFRVAKEPGDNYLRMEVKDAYLVRTRALITMLYHKAIEAVTRLAMVGLISTRDRHLMRQTCATSAQETIRWLLKGRVLAKNRGDLYCIWQLAPAPSCFLSLVYAIVDQVTTQNHLLCSSASVEDAVEWSWLNSLQDALDFLDVICDTERSIQLLQSYQSLHRKVQRIVCLERPLPMPNDDRLSSSLLSLEQAKDRIGLSGCHKTLDQLLSTPSNGFTIDADKWSEMEQWFALFLGEST